MSEWGTTDGTGWIINRGATYALLHYTRGRRNPQTILLPEGKGQTGPSISLCMCGDSTGLGLCIISHRGWTTISWKSESIEGVDWNAITSPMELMALVTSSFYRFLRLAAGISGTCFPITSIKNCTYTWTYTTPQ